MNTADSLPVAAVYAIWPRGITHTLREQAGGGRGDLGAWVMIDSSGRSVGLFSSQACIFASQRKSETTCHAMSRQEGKNKVTS